MDKAMLDTILSRVRGVSVVVVGDFFLDKYLHVDVSLEEVSIETGLPAYQVVGKKLAPGAAGVVTANLKAIGVGEVICVGAIGLDGEGYELKQGLKSISARTDMLVESGDIVTPTYLKRMAFKPGEPAVEMARIDTKNRARLSEEIEDAIIGRLRMIVPQVQGVAISDQVQERDCGVITNRIREELAALARANPNVFFLVDSRTRISEFRDVVIKPNKFEAARAAGVEFDEEPDKDQAREAGVFLSKATGKPVLVTVGEDGMLVVDGDDAVIVPGRVVEGEIDIVGAGDSSSAGIVAARCAGVGLQDAAAMGNLVASITVTKIGETGTASPDELRAVL